MTPFFMHDFFHMRHFMANDLLKENVNNALSLYKNNDRKKMREADKIRYSKTQLSDLK